MDDKEAIGLLEKQISVIGYTGAGWIMTLTKAEIKIPMPLDDFTNHLPVIDGRGRYLDNILIERLWRSLKQEVVYLHEIPPFRQIALQSFAG